ncbi:MAG: MFS transporter, partial [candidate division NC10 bacterium]|nr:MFS transporter [candidate division NC10 bacterium]
MFGYGFLAVVLVLYLAALGFDEARIGLLLTLTLAGDTAISLWMSTQADRYGRRRMLSLGSLLVLGAGLVFIASGDFIVLLLAATIGVISPSGNEVGPFLAIEQSALSQIVADERRTSIFAWYNLVGSFATAAGSLAGGGLATLG